MKKFLAVVFVLAALAGAGLFFGWAQRGVPPDAYGVLRSRSHGLDPALVVPGEFRWVWHKLIPTNASTSVFRIRPVALSFSERGELPSGRIYSAFLGTHLGIDGDFSWEISGSMSFALRREALVPLVEARNVGTQEELELYLDGLAGEIKAFVLTRFGSGELARQADSLILAGEIPGLAREIEGRFPNIADFSLRIGSARLPDFALYEQARAAHGEFFALRKEYISGRLPEMAEGRLNAFTRIEELELYGELLTRFPILLQYLMIEGRGAGAE